MIFLETPEDIALLRESVDLECKLATGREGMGQLPTSFWPTYSAFANSRGGVVLLGVREVAGGFEMAGLRDVTKIRRDLFNQLNNPQKISDNLLTDDNVTTLIIDGREFLRIDVPRAGRRHRPVFVNGNPLTGTYWRSDEGDRLRDRESVTRMLAEKTEDSRDNRVLKGFNQSDLSAESILAYRQAMRDRTPNHPFLDGDDTVFLRRIGAMGRDRENNIDGITIAGLLMFGFSDNIRDEFPNYTRVSEKSGYTRPGLAWRRARNQNDTRISE